MGEVVEEFKQNVLAVFSRVFRGAFGNPIFTGGRDFEGGEGPLNREAFRALPTHFPSTSHTLSTHSAHISQALPTHLSHAPDMLSTHLPRASNTCCISIVPDKSIHHGAFPQIRNGRMCLKCHAEASHPRIRKERFVYKYVKCGICSGTSFGMEICQKLNTSSNNCCSQILFIILLYPGTTRFDSVKRMVSSGQNSEEKDAQHHLEPGTKNINPISFSGPCW